MVFIGPAPGLPIATRMTIVAHVCVYVAPACAAKTGILRGDRVRLLIELKAAPTATPSHMTEGTGWREAPWR